MEIPTLASFRSTPAALAAAEAASPVSEAAGVSDNSPDVLVTPETPPWASAGRNTLLFTSAETPDAGEAVFFKTSVTGPGAQSQGPGQSERETDPATVPVRPGPGVTPQVSQPAVQETEGQPETAEVSSPAPAPTPPAPQPSDTPYVEPSPQAGTHLVDYFSNSAELRASQHLTDKTQSRLVEELEGLITAFENKTINSADDVYTVRQDYKDISAKLKQVQDGEDRRRLYDRCESRWLEFSSIIDTMGETIRVYEEKQDLLEQQQHRKAEEQAALDRKNQEIQDRITSFETALQMLEAMEYQSQDAESLANTAIAKLGELYGYADTESYRIRLDAAIRRIRSLPTEAEWNAQEAQKKADAISQGAKEQQALYQTLTAEKRYWNTPSYGPGRN